MHSNHISTMGVLWYPTNSIDLELSKLQRCVGGWWCWLGHNTSKNSDWFLRQIYLPTKCKTRCAGSIKTFKCYIWLAQADFQLYYPGHCPSSSGDFETLTSYLTKTLPYMLSDLREETIHILDSFPTNSTGNFTHLISFSNDLMVYLEIGRKRILLIWFCMSWLQSTTAFSSVCHWVCS